MLYLIFFSISKLKINLKSYTLPLIFSYSEFLLQLRSSLFIGEGNGNPLQGSCLENSMDGGARQAAVHGVTKSQTQLDDFTFFLSRVPFGKGNGNPLQFVCLENPMNGGAWWALVYGVAKSRTRLSNQHTHNLIRQIPNLPIMTTILTTHKHVRLRDFAKNIIISSHFIFKILSTVTCSRTTFRCLLKTHILVGRLL